MARRASNPRPSSQLARLEQRVAELNRARVPAVLVVPVFADDCVEDASSYAADLDRHLAIVAPGTAVVLVMHSSARPSDVRAMWAAPRAWLDPVQPTPPPGGDLSSGAHVTVVLSAHSRDASTPSTRVRRPGEPTS
jgi:hypothetical protein